MPLSLGPDESESLQMLLANIRGQIGFRACRCDVCNRLAHALVRRGCQKGVDVALMRPAAYDSHARDLSALVDLVRHDCEEVGTSRKQRVEVGHDVVLPDESMGPVELRIEVASHDLALVVDAAGYAAKISRQNTEGCKRVVLPKRAILCCAVGAADEPNNLVLVVNAEGESESSEVLKGGESAIFPRCGVTRRTAAGSRVAYGLASIVDPKCVPVWIATLGRAWAVYIPLLPFSHNTGS